MSNILIAKPLDYIQVIDTDDEADVRRVIELLWCSQSRHRSGAHLSLRW